MGKKIVVWLLAFCLLLAGGAFLREWASSVNGPGKGEPTGMTLYQPVSEVEGIRLEPDGYSWGTEADPPVLAVRWINKSDADFTFGADFDVLYKERGEWVSCAKGDIFVDAIGYVLKPGGQMRLEYSLRGFDMSRAGDYRFRVCPDGERALWFDFALRYQK